MHMSLSKRTHIMLDPSTFKWLKHQSSSRQVTIGSLVRTILEKEMQAEQDAIRQDRFAAFEEIARLRKKYPVKGPLDYKALVEEGRKY